VIVGLNPGDGMDVYCPVQVQRLQWADDRNELGIENWQSVKTEQELKKK
jgi:hypothetical protein